MSATNSNKPLVILQTSFSVSFICSLGLGLIFTVFQDQGFSRFLSMTYLFFVNNLLMPVSVAVIAYYYIDRSRQEGLWEEIRVVLQLSCIILFLLFVWNMADFIFHNRPLNTLTVETLLEDLREEFLLVVFLSLPVALLVSLIYNYMDHRD